MLLLTRRLMWLLWMRRRVQKVWQLRMRMRMRLLGLWRRTLDWLRLRRRLSLPLRILGQSWHAQGLNPHLLACQSPARVHKI
jgi:hypothetical protein